MLSLFEFHDYRSFLNAWIEAQGEGGYGLKGRMASSLGISSSLISQILSGKKGLTLEQSADLCDYLALTELESDYFQLLVEYDRAGTSRYRSKLERKLKVLREQSRRIGRRVPRHKELTDEQKAIYYSSWLYTGVRNLSALPDQNDIETMAKHLHQEPAVIARVVRFLLENGLCRDENGAITYGPASIHVDKESPFVTKHHQNWRFQGIHKMESRKDADLFFTSPMSLSRQAFEDIRTLLPNIIQNIMQISGPSPSETTACLNIDWFEY